MGKNIQGFLFWKLKKEARKPIDFLTLWICCTVWPGALAFLVFFEEHRIPLAFGIMVLAGLCTAIYIWTDKGGDGSV